MLAGISADPPEDTRAWQADEDPEDRLSFPLLSDADLAVCKAYGVHDAAHGMALPAVVVVHAEDGTVRWTRVGESIADRPTLDELLEVVRRLGPPR
ncbi:MAG: redoxin domain-containing protein [Planctomycetes bacterium]|nr:redoxin domain-containing protein [Planctomycetota bacterium]